MHIRSFDGRGSRKYLSLATFFASSPKGQVSASVPPAHGKDTDVEVAGGGIQSSGDKNPKNVKLGENVILAGLLIQVVFFGLFIITAGIFDVRLSKEPTTKSQQVPWRSHMNILYVTNGLVMLRSAFRVVEYAMGNNGYLLRHEVFLYVFDSVPMLFVMIAYGWKYPNEISEVLRGERNHVSRSTGDAELGFEMSQEQRYSKNEPHHQRHHSRR